MALGAGQIAAVAMALAGPKAIGDDCIRQISLPFQQPAQELEGRFPVAPRLHDDVEKFAFVVDGTPEVVEPSG
jgi:hypothetical protein